MRKLFIIGDSISINYVPYLEKMLKGFYICNRKGGLKESLIDLDDPRGTNNGDSSMVLSYIKKKQDKIKEYDTVLINCGLHDIKRRKKSEEIQITTEEYRDNLDKTTNLLKYELRMEVIWVRTTPVDEDRHNEYKTFLRFNKDIYLYNEIADKIMGEKDVPVIDLYSFMKNIPEKTLTKDGVHFIGSYCELQAAFIAGYLVNK